tara:strand:- start:70 stop:1140 length:1071 start_codon:yes stop_codon:yes gene_type:complete
MNTTVYNHSHTDSNLETLLNQMNTTLYNHSHAELETLLNHSHAELETLLNQINTTLYAHSHVNKWTIETMYTDTGGSAVKYSADNSYIIGGNLNYDHIFIYNISTGAYTIIAGQSGNPGSADGVGTDATFDYPEAIGVSPDGTYVLIGGRNNHCIRRLELSNYSVTTPYGQCGPSEYLDGIGTLARFQNIKGISISPDGNFAAVTDHGSSNSYIRLIELATANVTTLADSTTDSVTTPYGIDYSPDGMSIVFTEYSTDKIRLINVSTGQVTTIVSSNSDINGPWDIAYTPDGQHAVVGDLINEELVLLDTNTYQTTGLNTNTKGRGVDVSNDGNYALYEYNGVIKNITLKKIILYA